MVPSPPIVARALLTIGAPVSDVGREGDKGGRGENDQPETRLPWDRPAEVRTLRASPPASRRDRSSKAFLAESATTSLES